PPAIVKQALLVWGIYTDPSLVRELIARGADPNVRGQDGTTPLHAAMTAANIEGVRVLLDAGADPNAQDARGDAPLHSGAMRPGSIAVIRLLFERGARAGVWNNHGQLALHHAARNGDLELACLLIDAGEDLYAKHARNRAAMGEPQEGQMAGMMAHLMMEMQQMFKRHADPDLAPPEVQQAHQKALESLAQSPQGAALEQFLNMTPETAQASAQLFTRQGLSAAESAQLSPRGQAILAELEAYYQKSQESR
ncbi:MAG TPA: ankyrin repeat domain-containing protein, partial [Gemmataceae bacterium]|nr:ankyrin repeat domain-containing protein [Gemmataceae bacterium]